MSTNDLPTNPRPWFISFALVGAVFVLSLVARALIPPSLANTLGTGLLVLAAAVAGGTALVLLLQGKAISREFAFTLFLVFLFLSLILR